jgi:hypothetical protein
VTLKTGAAAMDGRIEIAGASVLFCELGEGDGVRIGFDALAELTVEPLNFQPLNL